MSPAALSRAAVASVLACFASGCVVPAVRYEEAQSRLRVEQAGHRQTALKLQELRLELRQAEAQLRARSQELESELEDRAEQLAQAQLDGSVASKESEQAQELVNQLRGELARVGDHLRTFSDQKGELAEALARAEARVERLAAIERDVTFRALVVRELSLALYEPLATGEFELAVAEGRVVLKVPAARMYTIDGDGLHSEAPKILRAVARIARQHAGAQVGITESGEAFGEQDPVVRLEKVSQGLLELGVEGERVTVKVPEPIEPVAQPEPAESADGAPEQPTSTEPQLSNAEPATVSLTISTESS